MCIHIYVSDGCLTEMDFLKYKLDGRQGKKTQTLLSSFYKTIQNQPQQIIDPILTFMVQMINFKHDLTHFLKQHQTTYIIHYLSANL